jgi:hypothetical protein
MKPSEAIAAYHILQDSIVSKPASNEAEKGGNTASYLKSFSSVLETANISEQALMTGGLSPDNRCQRYSYLSEEPILTNSPKVPCAS